MWGSFLAVAVALAGGGYMYLRLDDEIRRQVEQLFADHYRHLIVRVEKARFEKGQGITIYGLSISEPAAIGSVPRPILAVEEMFLACDMSLEEMFSGKPHIDRIVVRRPRLHASRLRDGRWSVQTLVPLPKLSDESPDLMIEDGTLLFADESRSTIAPLVLRGVDMRMVPDEQTQPSHADMTSLRRYQVTGSATGTPARQCKFAGLLGFQDGALELTFDVGGLELSPELLASIPGPRPEPLEDVQILGSADARLRVVRAVPSGELDWNAEVSLRRGRLASSRLPLPLTELQMKLTADPRRLNIEELRGKFGTADVVLACERHGWGPAAPIGLAGRVVGLAVDPQLEATLPARAQRLWRRFQPAGVVDAELRVTFDGERWRPEVSVDCRGLALTDAEKFPYPLAQATGTIHLTGSPSSEGEMQMQLNLTGYGNGQPVHIAAVLDKIAVPSAKSVESSQRLPAPGETAPTPKPVGWIEVTGEGIAIHDQLLAALPTHEFDVQALVRSLNPKGAVNFRWRCDRTDPFAESANKSLQLELIDCSILYDKFPYPLERLHGFVTSRDHVWDLKDIESRDRQGTAVVTCEGHGEPAAGGHRIQLEFRGSNVLLDDRLKQALSPEVQEVWSQLRPQGRVNFAAHVTRAPGETKPTVEVELQPQNKSVSIEPTFFPYRLEELDGRAHVATGRVTLEQVRCRHGRSTFSTDGTWTAAPGGGWQLTLTGLNADRVTLDADLLRALPPGVQRVMERLRPVGYFNLYRSSIGFVRRPDTMQVASSWDVQVACHQGAVRGELPLENLSGAVRVLGQNDGSNCFCYGELAIDSLIFSDVQLTNIRGPFWTDSTSLLLGRLATRKLAQPDRRVTANVFSGAVEGDLQLLHAGQPRYNTEITLKGVDLGRVSRERLGGPTDLKGTVSGTLSLSGAGRSTSALTGRGELRVNDANIYELPPLVALLKVLRNRTPDTTAFDRCDATFDIRGEHIHFHQLNLLGDAVSLYGRGETNFDRQLNLVFYTLVGPADLPIPLWKTVAGQLSQQGLQLKVDGTWENPRINREAFPAVSQMLEQIRSEAQQTVPSVPPPESARRWWTPPLR